MAGDKLNDATVKTTPDASEALAQQALSKPSDRKTLDAIASASHAIGAKTDEIVDGAGRLGTVTGKAIFSKDLWAGGWHAIQYDAAHIDQTVEMVAESAAFGAGLKAVMSSRSPLGAVAGIGVGLYFGAKALAPVGEAYGHALNAKSDKDLDVAAKELGDAGGTFAVNTGIGLVGFKAGAGIAGRVLEGEKYDGYMVAKENAWDYANSKIAAAGSKVLSITRSAMGADAGAALPEGVGETFSARAGLMEPKIKMIDDRAHLMTTAKDAPEGTVKGAVDPDSKVSITMLAQTKGSPLLMDRYINRITNRGAAPLTDDQITAKFGTDEASGKQIKKFAADHGLTIKDENQASGRYFVEGTAGNMQKAFGVNWQEYENNGVTFRGRAGTLSVTPEVAPAIKGVLGLDNRPQYHTNYVKLSDAPGEAPAKAPEAGAAAEQTAMDKIAQLSGKTAVGHLPTDVAAGAAGGTTDASAKGANPEAAVPIKPRAMTVAEMFKAYGKPENLTGKGMVTGFLSLGGTMPKGWSDYLTSKGINPANFKEINLSDEAPTPDPKGANGENGLDGVIHKEALPDAKTVMVQAPNNDSGMPDGIDRITFPKPGEDQITHASVSWGQYEDGWTAQSRAAMTDAGKRAALKGVTITVAAGDNGAGDGSPSRIQQVDDPAGTGAYTSAGGTMLLANKDGSYNSEKTWSGMGATGGGRSMFSPRGAWTDFLKTIPKNLNGSTFDGSPVPDIALASDPRSGWLTFTDDGVIPIGGTSAAAPGTAVIASAITEATGKKTGFWNPQLWAFGRDKVDVYNDVTLGNNTDEGVKGYPATPGYDLNTGWGSPKIPNMIKAYNDLGNGTPVAKSLALTKDVFRQSYGTQAPAWLIPSQNLTSQQLDDIKAGASK